MPFQLFHDLFPAIAEAETRSITVFEDQSTTGLPKGHYAFCEMFCNERDCDCRRVFFYVVSWAHLDIVTGFVGLNRGVFPLEVFPMTESTGNPLRDLELRIEKEGEDYKRRRMREEMQKLADREPAISPPDEGAPAQSALQKDDTPDTHG